MLSVTSYRLRLRNSRSPNRKEADCQRPLRSEMKINSLRSPGPEPSRLGFFFQKRMQFQACLVKLRFRCSDGAAKYLGDLFVFKAFDIVQHKHILLACGQLVDSVRQSDLIDDRHLKWALGSRNDLNRRLAFLSRFLKF